MREGMGETEWRKVRNGCGNKMVVGVNKKIKKAE